MKNLFLSASIPDGVSLTITKTIEDIVEKWVVKEGRRIVWSGMGCGNSVNI